MSKCIVSSSCIWLLQMNVRENQRHEKYWPQTPN